VGTPEDPTTSREGESFYQFLPRSVIGSYLSAWSIESKRLTEIKGFKSAWVPQNRMLWFGVNNVVLPVIVQKCLGWYGLAVFVCIAMTSIFYLEGINYIEHYGLRRKELDPGVYEKVTVRHSWNAPHGVTNYFLFKLQRHSDHHLNSYKPYQTLLTMEESPMLASGYALSILMVFVPRVWFSVMNPILKAHHKERTLSEEERGEVERTMKRFMWRACGGLTGMAVCWSLAG